MTRYEKMMEAADAYAEELYKDEPRNFKIEEEISETIADFCAGWNAAEMLERSIVKADIESIIRAVTRETGVTDEEMTHHCRHREYTEARMIVCWLAYHYTQMTLTTIGKRLGRGHGTASYYNMVVDSWLNEPRLNLRGARIATKLIREIEA